MGNKRFHQMTPDVAHLTPLVESQGLKVIAKCFGVTPASLSHWIREGKAPHWTLLGAEALNRRMGKFASDHRDVIIVQVGTSETISLVKIVKALGGIATVLPSIES